LEIHIIDADRAYHTHKKDVRPKAEKTITKRMRNLS
jgi:hypothetical protein